MQLSILIVAYNACEHTRRCLESVFAETRNVPFEVIVVDNASTEPTVPMIRESFPQVRLIEQSENLGFGRAVNLAAEHARGEYLLLLNPDTVVHDAALERLLAFARAHPRYGVYGGRTLDGDGNVDPSSCWGKPTLWSYFCFATGLSTLFRHSRWLDPESLGRWPRDSVRSVGVVTGCLCLIPRERWRALGGFEPRFFMYGEDADLCMRAAESGLEPVITPEATVTHFVGKSSAVHAHKRILLLKGKATLVRLRWKGLRGRLGLFLLAAGVGLRARLRFLGGQQGAWVDAWEARREWLPGYPEPSSHGSGRSGPAVELSTVGRVV